MEKGIITNKELQVGLSERLRGLDQPNPDFTNAKVYASLAGKLISTLKLEIDARDKIRLGISISENAKTFFGE